MEQKMTEISINRTYKDTLFRMLFNSKEDLLSLYNALNHTNYTDETQLEIVTLENAIYMNMKNDFAFVIDFYLNLYEHQSTYCGNMPLRNLFYVAREYQMLVDEKSLYAVAVTKIPTPRFVVFYNGIEEYEERKILRLSDAYERQVDDPDLELKVLMLNINSGNNREILEQCQKLKEYMYYVELVRTYASEMQIKEAVERAVRECIQKGILSEFLQKNRVEAIAVSIFEYDEAKEKEKMRKAEFEAGVEQGREEGLQALILDNFEEGKSESVILEKLCKRFQLSGEQAKKYFEKYAVQRL